MFDTKKGPLVRSFFETMQLSKWLYAIAIPKKVNATQIANRKITYTASSPAISERCFDMVIPLLIEWLSVCQVNKHH